MLVNIIKTRRCFIWVNNMSLFEGGIFGGPGKQLPKPIPRKKENKMSKGTDGFFRCASCGKEWKITDTHKMKEVEFKDISFFFCNEQCQKEYLFKEEFRKKDE